MNGGRCERGTENNRGWLEERVRWPASRRGERDLRPVNLDGEANNDRRMQVGERASTAGVRERDLRPEEPVANDEVEQP
jgi:hypothetical protein